MSSGFVWERRPEQVFPEHYDDYARNLYVAIGALCDRYAIAIIEYMKQNAPWIDRTGLARSTLYALVFRLAEEIVIVFDYGVDYGIFLSLSNQGVYDIVRPAMDHFAPLIVDDLIRLLS